MKNFTNKLFAVDAGNRFCKTLRTAQGQRI